MQPSRTYAFVLSAIATLMLGSTYRPPERGLWLAGVASAEAQPQIRVPVIPAARPISQVSFEQEPLAGITAVALTAGNDIPLSKGFCGLLEFNAGDAPCLFKQLPLVEIDGTFKLFNARQVVKDGPIDIVVINRTADDGNFYRTTVSASLRKAVYAKKGEGMRVTYPPPTDQVASQFAHEVQFWRSQERQLSASLMPQR